MEKKLPESMKKLLEELRERAKDYPRLMEQFYTCYTNTLDTTVEPQEDGTVHVITGDIPAMWLRDSAAQVRPYIFLAKEDREIAGLLEGVVRRQFRFLCIDPYANAFNKKPDGSCWEKDDPDQNPWVWERKFEIDSLCYPIQLAWLLWKNAGCTGQFDDCFVKGAHLICQVLQREQAHEEQSDYRFIRKNSFWTDTLSRDGRGALVKSGTGLVWSGFRPSDDACVYGYLIPANMFAAVALGYLEEIAGEILGDAELKEKSRALREELHAAVEKHGKTLTEEFGMVYAYETDGYGMYNLMDDANVPSLLSMGYLGYPADREAYENTRRMILSEANPYYYSGSRAAGIGSPHTPSGYIWHIAMAVQGLTAETREEKLEILEKMAETAGEGGGMMHEGFHKDDASKYTREWFSWANAMYAELFLDCFGYSLER